MSADDADASEDGEAMLVRRIRLPADRRTPAAARAAVRDVLAETALTELLDEALLLTTELTTNGVMHAGTDLDIEITADRTGVTVTVTDFAPGSLARVTVATGPTPAPPFEPDLAERGRGLLLVGHFASRWGTTHLASGKGVWFRLDRRTAGPVPVPAARRPAAEAYPTDLTAVDAAPNAGPQPDLGAGPYRDVNAGPHAGLPAGAYAGAAAGRAGPTAAGLAALLSIRPDGPGEEAVVEFARALLNKAAELFGAAGGVVRLDRGDGAGAQPIARCGREPAGGASTLAIPLGVTRPYAGELRLELPPSAFARPLAVLVAERLSLYLENDRLRRADLRRQTWLTFLAEASELLAQSLDVHLTMALIPQLVVPRLGEWCAVHTADGWGQLHLAAATHADEAMLPDLLAALKETGPETVDTRLREASRLGTHLPLPAPLEGFAIPLKARDQQLGTLAVGRHAAHRHDPDEVAVLEDVARRAALAIDNARIHDERRRVAHTLQQSLLPPVLPVVAGMGFAAEYVPTGDAAEVGGDFYDVVPLSQDRWLVVVGDVSGKGVPAAAVTGLVRDVIRVLAQDGRALPDMLTRLNDTLFERGGGRYCTLALAAVGRRADRTLEVSLHLAGHDRPVLVREGRPASFVGTGGTALGLLRAIESPSATVTLAPGDALIFYTDGVTERRRGDELFGTDRLRDAATPLAGYSADVVAARLRTATLSFSSETPRDDIALLVLRNESGTQP